MTEKGLNLKRIAPVLMAFFVMSFVDLVGIGVDRVTNDFKLTQTLAQLIPSATFLWFFLLSVPIGVFQSRVGKRFMLNVGMGVTALGLLFPVGFAGLLHSGTGNGLYSFPAVLTGFALLGIGNTIVQVSANPLMVDVVPGNRASSFLSFSQFVKAIGSILGAPLALFFTSRFGDWRLMFFLFGIVSVLSVIWLASVKVEESGKTETKASIGSAFKLLGTPFILLMVISIFLVVGIDVGFNSNSGQFLIKRFGIESGTAEQGRSVYFFGRMLGTFAGAMLLTRISSRKFFMWTSLAGLICLILIVLIKSQIMAWGLVFLIGLTVANIWPLVFSIAVERYPDRSNEISGLMMMAISGGAVIPLLVGWLSDITNMRIGMTVLIFSMIYLYVVSLYCSDKKYNMTNQKITE